MIHIITSAKFRIILGCLLLLPLVCSFSTSVVATENKIIILPFQMHAPSDMAYLREAIVDMLSSRIEIPGHVTVLKETPTPGKTDTPNNLMTQLQADFLISGSMTILGNEISTDARLFKSGMQEPLMVFHEYGNTADGVLAHVEKLAEATKQNLTADTPPVALVAPQEERTASNLQSVAPYYWNSQALKYPVVGMTAGDLNGDGDLEWILAGEDAVYIYNQQEDELVLDVVLSQKSGTLIGVDVAGIDNESQVDLVVTRKRKGYRIDSAVYQWQDGTYVETQKGLRWYFRSLRDVQGRSMLMGQKQGNVSSFRSDSAEQNLFLSGIYTFQQTDKGYQPISEASLPEDINIYWLGFGDIMGSGNQQTLAVKSKGYLSLLSQDGTPEWTSAERYGGSNVYLETPAPTNLDQGERFYLSQRIHVIDLNSDKRGDVIIARNKDAGNRLFKRFRNYKSGTIDVLTWRNTGLETVWQTEELSGYISDTWLSDVNGDNRPELAYCVVTRAGVLSGDYTSRLFIEEIPNF